MNNKALDSWKENNSFVSPNPNGAWVDCDGQDGSFGLSGRFDCGGFSGFVNCGVNSDY